MPIEDNALSCRFEALLEMLSEEFVQLPDYRRADNSYRLAAILRCAFAMFSLKSLYLVTTFTEVASPV